MDWREPKLRTFENVHEQNFWKIQDRFWKEQAQKPVSGPLYFSRDKLEVSEHNYGAFDARREWVEVTEPTKVEAKKSKKLKVEVEPPSLFSVFNWFFSVFKFFFKASVFLLLPGIFKAFLSFIFLPFSCVLSILKFCKAVYQVRLRPCKQRKQADYVQGRAFPPIRLVLIGGGAAEVRAAEFTYERRTFFWCKNSGFRV